MRFDLSKFQNSFYKPGNIFLRSLWYFNSIIFFESKIPIPQFFKKLILKIFGSKLGKGVVIKPSVKIKYPWQLEIGDNSWIGERVWIDNVATIKIGSNVCISQGVMLESGNHNFKSEGFDLLLEPIIIENNVWIGCNCLVLPATVIKKGSIFFGGTVINKKTKPNSKV